MDTTSVLRVVLLVIISVICAAEFLALLRVISLLQKILSQLNESNAESRTLLRNTMSIVQESVRGLAIEVRTELRELRSILESKDEQT